MQHIKKTIQTNEAEQKVRNHPCAVAEMIVKYAKKDGLFHKWFLELQGYSHTGTDSYLTS